MPWDDDCWVLAPWTWSQDTREELALNLSLLAEAFLQLLASGLGTLALVWATVVLLGGYSTALVRMDFWFTTAIVFVETARYVTNVLPSFLILNLFLILIFRNKKKNLLFFVETFGRFGTAFGMEDFHGRNDGS